MEGYFRELLDGSQDSIIVKLANQKHIPISSVLREDERPQLLSDLTKCWEPTAEGAKELLEAVLTIISKDYQGIAQPPCVIPGWEGAYPSFDNMQDAIERIVSSWQDGSTRRLNHRAKELKAKEQFLNKTFGSLLAELDRKKAELAAEQERMMKLLREEYADALQLPSHAEEEEERKLVANVKEENPEEESKMEVKQEPVEGNSRKSSSNMEIKRLLTTTEDLTEDTCVTFSFTRRLPAQSRPQRHPPSPPFATSASGTASTPSVPEPSVEINRKRKRTNAIPLSAIKLEKTSMLASAKSEAKAFGLPVLGLKKQKQEHLQPRSEPPPATPAYVFFTADYFAIIVNRHPHLGFDAHVKLVADEWRKLDDEQRQKYEQMAQKDRDRWEQEVANFEANNKAAFRNFRLQQFSVLAEKHPDQPSETILKMLEAEWMTMNGFQKAQYLAEGYGQ